jgi:ribosomal protein S18 acetylase RimI-like enzyme
MSDFTAAAEAFHTIRRAGVDDFAAIRRQYALVQDAHAAHMPGMFRPMEEKDFPVEHYLGYLRDYLVLVAETDGAAVGSLLASSRQVEGRDGYLPCRNVFIWYVVTEPAMRGRGIARSLIGAAAEWAAEKEADRIDLSVWSFNTNALELYRKLGFAHAYTGMMINPAEVLARCGTGRLPKQPVQAEEAPAPKSRLPSWLSPRR